MQELVCTLCRYNRCGYCKIPDLHEKACHPKKVVDISLLPPCKQASRLHSTRANAIATMWKLSTTPEINLSEITDVGWYSDMSIQWTENEFPEDLRDILLDFEEDDVDMGIYEESDDNN